MSTVIIGAGIIGVSTAYYLSQNDPSNADRIHLVEASPDLFASASGFAGGFLAEDWFSPSLSNLGKLSFRLHKELAEAYNGHELWGYSQSTGTSLAEDTVESNGGSGADWLRDGASRAEAAKNTDPNSSHAPQWLKSKGELDVLSFGETTAQCNPRHLCDFLLSSCLSRGVQLHQPARPTGIVRHSSSTPESPISALHIRNTATNVSENIPCDHLVIAAGAWSAQVLSTLFPKSKYKLPVTSLAGHSLVLRTPHWPPKPLDPTDPVATKDPANSTTTTNGQEKKKTTAHHPCHAVFTTEAASGTGEAYSPELFSRMPNGEVYLAGLNSATYPLPRVAHERHVDDASIVTLKKTAKRLLGDDVEVVRESVCWRPVTQRGTPIVGRLEGKMGEMGRGVYVAAGHGAWGISLSLGTGWCVARMIGGGDVGEWVGRLGV